MSQTALAELCGVNQGVVTRWEQDAFQPKCQAIVALARLSGEPDKWWWLEQLGLTEQDLSSVRAEAAYMLVPLLKEAAAAGTGRIISESEIDDYLTFPKEWLPHTRSITALKVKGDSMSPIIEEGYIVLVDTSQRDPNKLINEMVAAREDGGVTIKWLRKAGKFFHLMPQHTSVRHPVRIIAPGDDFGIVGKIIKWIGEPQKK